MSLIKKIFRSRSKNKKENIAMAIENLESFGPVAVKQLSKALKTANIKGWLEFGTLLGAVRDSGFISHDFDIDIAMRTEDYTEKFLDIMRAHGFNLKSSFEEDGKVFEVSFWYEDKLDIDIFLCDSDDKHMLIYDFIWPEGSDKTSLRGKQGGAPMSVNKLTPFELEEIKFLDVDFFIPSNTELHLTELYGADYMTPNPGWKHSSRSVRSPIDGSYVKRKRYPKPQLKA